MTKSPLNSELSAAVKALYTARRDRRAHPDGSFDRGGRWYPSDAENADNFTSGIRGPSRSWPYSYMVAARTLKHVKALASVNPDYVLREASKLENKAAA